MLQAKFHHQWQPQQREEVARGKQTQTGEAAALAQKGELFGNRAVSGPLSLAHRYRACRGTGALWGEHVGTHRSSGHMGLPLRDVAVALMSATAHTGPGTEESKKMLTD